MALDINEVYLKFKRGKPVYDPDIHCPMLLKVMADSNKGRLSAFCVEAQISERTFWYWIKEYPLFSECYYFGFMISREAWEKEGERLRDYEVPMGTISYGFEHWKMIGWSRFGISKNSRIKLDLNADDDPSKHYAQLLKQAAEGHFTASEIKQLMEAINVGLNTHQVFTLQKEIDQLKLDLKTMAENSNAHNSSTNKRIAQNN